MNGNCCTHPLIPPDLLLNHPGATSYTSKEYAMKNDPEFVEFCQVTNVQAVIEYQETHLTMFAKE